MSGMVVKLNDDEEDEDEDDAGLLSSRDEEDDDFHSSAGRSGGLRGVLKNRLRHHDQHGRKMPYPGLRSGTVMQLLNTLTICCIFFGMVRVFKNVIEIHNTAFLDAGLDQILD